jgi:tetratricopeptide (TPR) repeat protein
LQPALDDPSSPAEVRSQLAAQLYALALAERDARRPAEAAQHVLASLRISGQFADQNPGDRGTRVLRAQGLLLLGLIERDRGKAAEAVPSLLRAAEMCETVLREVPGEPQVQGHLVEVLVEGLGKTYRKLGRAADALASYRRAADVLAAMGRQTDPTDLYNLACCLAQCAALGMAAEGPAASLRSAQDADRALAALRMAIEAGGCNRDDVDRDTDLEPLRTRPDFQALRLDPDFPAEPFAP